MARRAPFRATALAVLCAACSHHAKLAQVAPTPLEPNTLSAEEQRGGWSLLFDGRSLTGWHTYQKDFGITTGWTVADGAIAWDSAVGDLVSDLQFGSFELELEWKISPGGNSGLFWWANEGTSFIYYNAPEVQILDNAGHPDGKSPLTSAGALYGLYPALAAPVKPVGEWNKVELSVRGSKVEEWLNDVKILDVNFDSDEMKQRIAASKFKDYPVFGKSRRGHIGLQNHDSKVWFRNIKIREFE